MPVDEIDIGLSYVGSSVAFIIGMFSAIGLAAFALFFGRVNMLEPVTKTNAACVN